jgi:hypothetical protein
MKKLLFIGIVLVGCNSGRNELMTKLINQQKSLNDSLEYYKAISSNAKLAVDTLSDSDLLRVGAKFLEEQSKIRINQIPKIARLEESLKNTNQSIDSLTKMK